MHKEKLLSIGFVALLLLSMATVMVPVSADEHDAAAIWVDPGSYLTAPELDTLKECDTFTVTVKINVTAASCTPPATGMYGWDYKLKWDASNLNLTSYAINIPPEWGANWFKPADSVGAHNATHDRHWFGVSALAPAPALNENSTTMPITVCTYNFHVIKTVYEPAGDEIAKLDLQDTKIADDTGGVIVHTAYDALYRKCEQPIPKPQLRVVPQKTQGVCGQLFNVSIAIYNIYAGWDLWGWEANLTFDPTWVCATNRSFEGPGLLGFAGPNGTYYVNIVDPANGWALSAGGFLGNHTPPHAPGASLIVSLIEFNACVQTIAPTVVETEFNLTNTKLVGKYPNGTLFNIQHTVRHGRYNVPYKIVGWSLDCYTDDERKKCYGGVTSYVGLGINATADSYETQDLVILFAYLEYNFQPESNKIVMFEIYGPNRTISIIRTAITNCSGIATIQFTIPHIPAAFGHWVCYQAAQVKIYEKPEDWLFWKVGWLVEITNVTVIDTGWADPAGPKRCEYIEVLVEYKTIMFCPTWVLFTCIVLDELLDPIQEEVWWVWVDGVDTPGVLCSERYDNTTELSHIACYAHAGEATVYVNAFTDFPMLCGCPFCPEATATFFVVASDVCC